jgi:excisionase family DNA binding protein
MVAQPRPLSGIGDNTMPESARPTEPDRQSRRHPPKPVSTTIDDCCDITGLGRTKVYQLISEGKLKAVAIGRRRLVVYSSIEKLIHGAAA